MRRGNRILQDLRRSAKVAMLARFKDCPEPANMPGMDPSMAEKIMHGRLQIGESTINVSDGRCGGTMKFDGFSLTLSVPSEAEADRVFNALSDGGTVTMPLTKTFFSSRFGMVNDRFGIIWMVIVEA